MATTKGTLYLNHNALGTFTFDDKHDIWTLDRAQTDALLAALPKKDVNIVFSSATDKWTLSDKGAAAVFLEMDEFQKRVNTPSALMKRGKSNKAVLMPQPHPQIKAVIPPQTPARTLEAGGAEALALQTLLRKNFTQQDFSCFDWEDNPPSFKLYPLDQGRVLSESACWSSVSNTANHYAILDEDLKTVLMPLYGSVEDHFMINHYNPAKGTLSATHTVRETGDCWWYKEWHYNGERFIQTTEIGHGQCKGFPGGAWEMPVLISEIIE